MSDCKRDYSIGYEYENKYGKFKIIDKELRYESNRWVYTVECQKCGHLMYKKYQEIGEERKCLGCTRNMEYSFCNVGDIVNGLKIIAKSPMFKSNGDLIKAYLCECIVDGKKVQIRESHLKNGVGCMECAVIKRGIEQRKKHDDYVKEMADKNPFIEITGYYIDQDTKIEYRCKLCGYEGMSLPNNLLRGGGCPICNMSIGEKKVMKYLQDHNIKYEFQYPFYNCKNIFCLPFDFYLPDYNTCIEYDGEQHFRAIEHFGGVEGFKRRQQNDNIKTDYCKDNNINLCRIRYDQNVNTELDNFLSNLHNPPSKSLCNFVP